MATRLVGDFCPTSVAQLWSQHAEALADWALSREIVRRDVFGSYGTGGGTYTGHEAINRAVLVRHFQGTRIIGAHSTNGDNLCRWVACDIDAHDDQADEDRNWECALAAAAGLARFGLNPLILDSNGRGGFHVKAWFKHTIDASIARWLCEEVNAALVEDGYFSPEWFPKQASVSLDAPFGIWLRIPGRHHKWEGHLEALQQVRRRRDRP
jgi:hypothetical protein